VIGLGDWIEGITLTWANNSQKLTVTAPLAVILANRSSRCDRFAVQAVRTRPFSDRSRLSALWSPMSLAKSSCYVEPTIQEKECSECPAALSITAEVALKREVLEEIGLTVKSIEYLTSEPNAYVYRGVTLPVLDFFYIVEVDEGPIELVDGEITSWIWTELTDDVLDQLVFVSNRRALERYRDSR
jgi:hypothetical protein